MIFADFGHHNCATESFDIYRVNLYDGIGLRPALVWFQTWRESAIKYFGTWVPKFLCLGFDYFEDLFLFKSLVLDLSESLNYSRVLEQLSNVVF